MNAPEEDTPDSHQSPMLRCSVCGRRNAFVEFDGIDYSCPRCIEWAAEMMRDNVEIEDGDEMEGSL